MPGTSLPHGDDGTPRRFRKPARFPDGDAVAAATCGVVTSAAGGLIGDATAATGAADATAGRPALAAVTMRDCAEVTGAQAITSEWNVARLFRSDGRDTRNGEFDLPEVRACLAGASAAA
jgi:hypothetical protein